jgi:hypothetical protein
MTDTLPMTMNSWRSTVLVAGTVAIALIGTSAAFAAGRPTIDCTLRFQLSGWSAIYERVDGTGIVACSDDTLMPVDIQARGAGFTVGKPKVISGTGKFASVHRISDVFGTYSQADVHAVVARTSAAEMTNGKVSLELAGNGEGDELGVAIAGFTIRPR